MPLVYSPVRRVSSLASRQTVREVAAEVVASVAKAEQEWERGEIALRSFNAENARWRAEKARISRELDETPDYSGATPGDR